MQRKTNEQCALRANMYISSEQIIPMLIIMNETRISLYQFQARTADVDICPTLRVNTKTDRPYPDVCILIRDQRVFLFGIAVNMVTVCAITVVAKQAAVTYVGTRACIHASLCEPNLGSNAFLRNLIAYLR